MPSRELLPLVPPEWTHTLHIHNSATTAGVTSGATSAYARTCKWLRELASAGQVERRARNGSIQWRRIAPVRGSLRPMSEAPRDGEILVHTRDRAGCKGWLIVHWADGGGEEQPHFRGWFFWTGFDFREANADAFNGWVSLPEVSP